MIVHPILLQCKTDEVIPIILTSDSASKSYDGTALTADHVTIDGDLDARDSFTFDVFSSQTQVGESINTFVWTLTNVSGKTYQVQKIEGILRVTDEDVPSYLVVNKSYYDSGPYRLDDLVTFSILVTNIYDDAQTITLSEIEDVTLSDSIFTSVEGGAARTTTATYKITEADILRGEFTNTVTATIGNYTYTAETSVETEEPNGHLSIEKTVLNAQEKYGLGEVIHYQLNLLNDGNLTITNILLKDELTGDVWTISSLAPGESKPFLASYTVTEANILNKEIINIATAQGSSPNEDEPDVLVTPGIDTESVDDPNGELTIILSSSVQNNESIASNRIYYTVQVTNTGNLTLTSITVQKDLTGDLWTIDSLAPSATQSFSTSYQITAADIETNEIVSAVTAFGSSHDHENPTVTSEATDIVVLSN